ncbi:hypothetical protein MSG28_003757 [Choristoneura fumiferana]|uniref:Uncharacterized protein n=1 Tax=Choristoneura fumiferana TaxID=7141 RepID=A0ACC0KG20_CHOFU|nr:hypothetical protein MSG28_003757 [Choristoneura fumiferana]
MVEENVLKNCCGTVDLKKGAMIIAIWSMLKVIIPLISIAIALLMSMAQDGGKDEDNSDNDNDNEEAQIDLPMLVVDGYLHLVVLSYFLEIKG